MTALSIRNMNFTLARRAQEGTMETKPSDDHSHYWFIERKALRKKNGKANWIFVRDFMATKREAADLFVRLYSNRIEKFRLHHVMKYGA